MCSEFEQDLIFEDLVENFDLETPPPRVNHAKIRPTDLALIIDGQGAASLLSWGFPASWDNSPLFNARSETLQTKPSFSPYLENRCLVPASAFTEWRKDEKKRHKNRISLENNGSESIMVFAGLRFENYFTIITCPASKQMEPVHHRMPVILSSSLQKQWLNMTLEYENVSSLLAPYQGDNLRFREDVPERSKQPDLFAN